MTFVMGSVIDPDFPCFMNLDQINDFFTQYALTTKKALSGADVVPTEFAKSFAAFVIGANPLGILGGKNDEDFINSITSGIQFYKRIGIQSMNIISTEFTQVDDFHVMTKVSWKCIYTSSGPLGDSLGIS